MAAQIVAIQGSMVHLQGVDTQMMHGTICIHHMDDVLDTTFTDKELEELVGKMNDAFIKDLSVNEMTYMCERANALASAEPLPLPPPAPPPLPAPPVAVPADLAPQMKASCVRHRCPLGDLSEELQDRIFRELSVRALAAAGTCLRTRDIVRKELTVTSMPFEDESDASTECRRRVIGAVCRVVLPQLNGRFHPTVNAIRPLGTWYMRPGGGKVGTLCMQRQLVPGDGLRLDCRVECKIAAHRFVARRGYSLLSARARFVPGACLFYRLRIYHSTGSQTVIELPGGVVLRSPAASGSSGASSWCYGVVVDVPGDEKYVAQSKIGGQGSWHNFAQLVNAKGGLELYEDGLYLFTAPCFSAPGAAAGWSKAQERTSDRRHRIKFDIYQGDRRQGVSLRVDLSSVLLCTPTQGGQRVDWGFAGAAAAEGEKKEEEWGEEEESEERSREEQDVVSSSEEELETC